MGVLKKVAAAVAVKEIVENVMERVEERRHPKRSLLSKMRKPVVLGALGGAGAWLYKNGKLGPVAAKLNEMRSGSSNGVPPNTGAPQMTPDAPAAVSGSTPVSS